MSMEQLAQGWGQFVTRHRLLTLAVSLAVTVCAALGGQHLSFTNDYRTFFTGDDPHLLAFENLQDTYVGYSTESDPPIPRQSDPPIPRESDPPFPR
ncbi:MAG: hypothetical protein OXS40_06960 [Gammaproteobacteria bacterium]|nr:hypothetical protein [Gammaproteobacteria bacterium]